MSLYQDFINNYLKEAENNETMQKVRNFIATGKVDGKFSDLLNKLSDEDFKSIFDKNFKNYFVNKHKFAFNIGKEQPYLIDFVEDVYEFTGDKRTDRLIKKKSIRECVLKCVGTTPHTNPAKGIIGSLQLEGTIVDKNVGQVFVKVSTGSGLSKFDINCEPGRYIGEYIEIMYNSVTTVDGVHSLFLPRYKRIVKRR